MFLFKMTKKDTYYLPHFDSNKVVTGTYDCRADKRLVVNVRDITTKKSIQQLYSRYIAEQCLGRYLSSEEEIDHIDRDKFNDSYSNLRIVSKSQNVIDDQKRIANPEVQIQCMECGIFLIRKIRDINDNIERGKVGPFCRPCGGKYGTDVQKGIQKSYPLRDKIKQEYIYNDKVIDNPIPFNEKFFSDLENAFKSSSTKVVKIKIVKEKQIKIPKVKKIKVKKERIFTKYDYWDPQYFGRSLYIKLNRKFIIIVNKDKSSDKRHVTYARFLMENFYQRRLDPNKETVDHIDNDCSNDELSNLKLMTRAENAAKEQEYRKECGLPMILPKKTLKFKPNYNSNCFEKGLVMNNQKKHLDLNVELSLGLSEIKKAQEILSNLIDTMEQNNPLIGKLNAIASQLGKANYRIDKAKDIHNDK